jgi:tetratricopeptide (TPR) repeat protein
MANTLTVDLVARAKLAAARESHEEAYECYSKALADSPDNAEAWLGKGIAGGWRSTPGNFTLPEMVDCIKRAIELTPVAQKGEVALDAAAAINLAARACNKQAFKSLANFIRLDETWGEYVEQSTAILDALKYAHELAPDDLKIVKTLIKVCVANLQEIVYEDIFDRDENGFPRSKLTELPPQFRKQFKRELTVFVAKRRLVEPGYRPPKLLRTTRVPAILAVMGGMVLASLLWMGYCYLEAAPVDLKARMPGLSEFTSSYIVRGLEKAYGEVPCKITHVDQLPEGVYQVTGKIRLADKSVVLFQQRIRYRPDTSASPYSIESPPRFETDLQFSP